MDRDPGIAHDVAQTINAIVAFTIRNQKSLWVRDPYEAWRITAG
jgi:hypothetical protein